MADKTYLKTTLAIVAILFLLAQLTSAAPPRYEVIDLGTLPGLPGWYASVAGSINDRGDIVGSVSGGAWFRATLFDASGSGNNIDLGTLGGNWSLGPSINNNGKIVGYAKNASAFWRATLFHPSGIAIDNLDLGTLGGNHSFAHSINDNGQIVGSAENSSGYERATLFDPTGHRNNIELGTLGGLESKAYSINDSGRIIGWAEIRPLSVVSHATLFGPTGSGANIDLGTLGGNQSLAFSINDSGQIVGKSRNSSGYERATLFDSSGAGDNVDLGTLGGDSSSAEWFNDNGQIVGAAATTSGDMRATLFDSTGHGNNIDLNTLIDSDCGWTLVWASSINNNGWIVGGGDNPAGQYHAFLMTPVPRTIYVDDNVAGANDGSSWANAYNFLQDALADANSGDEICVAQGIYKPDQGYGITPGSRTARFRLINGVSIKGGYAGFGEPDPNASNIQLYETILSGDLLGNDDPDVWQTKGENSYHVVTGNGTDANAVLDGFTVSGGNANSLDGHAEGGGMYNSSGNPTIANCIFIRNMAFLGGGMSNNNSNPTLTNCTCTGNMAAWDGGGMYNLSSTPTVTNCIFWGNNNGQIRGSGVNVTYSDIQGGWPGEGNIDADPCFVDPGYWDANGIWIDGDYHLQSQAGRWDPNSQTWVTDANTSPCIDAGDPNSDWTAELWPHGKRINMGAYGGTPEASMSLSDTGNIADLDTDGWVYYRDMMLFTDKWLYEEVLLPEDLNRDGIVNFTDFAIFADNLEPPPPGQASNPHPYYRATNVNINYDLSWTAGGGATSHDVYFGTSSSPPFIRNQTATTFEPGTMTMGTTYYWRVDAVNAYGTTTGTVWYFTTESGPPPT